MSNLAGKKDLSFTFVMFLVGWGVLFGEVVPVWLQEAPQGSPGAKESMFASLEMLIPTVIVYVLLALLFWWLFRKAHWVIVICVAAFIGVGMEFLLFRPEEVAGPHVTEDPFAALLLFVIIWPLLLLLPFCVYNGCAQFVKSRVQSFLEARDGGPLGTDLHK